MGRRPGLPTVRLDDDHGDIYQFSFTVRGRRYKGSTGKRDFNEAEGEAQRLYGEALTGKQSVARRFASNRATASEGLTDLFGRFVASLVGKKSKSYLSKIESHFVAHFAHRWSTLDEIMRPGAIDSYASDRLAGKAPAFEANARRPRPAAGSSVTVHKELVSLRRFLKWCKKMGLIDELPHIEPVPQVSDYAPPDYTEADTRRLLGAVPDRHSHRRGFPAREFFTVQWSQAFRPGELESLRWLDVNLSTGEVTIRPSEDKSRDGRTIHLTKEARGVLRSLQRERKPLPTALIFGACNYRGSLEAAAKMCGLPRPTRHNLRHFRLTELGHLPNVAPAALQFLAGHKHMQTTDRYIRSRTKATKQLLDSAPVFRPGRARR